MKCSTDEKEMYVVKFVIRPVLTKDKKKEKIYNSTTISCTFILPWHIILTEGFFQTLTIDSTAYGPNGNAAISLIKLKMSWNVLNDRTQLDFKTPELKYLHSYVYRCPRYPCTVNVYILIKCLKVP